jgi:hypothetical protein
MFSEETKRQTFRAAVGKFTELEDMLYVWIERRNRAHLPVKPSLAIAKAKSIASDLAISEDEFKASWQWFSRFRARRGLQQHQKGLVLPEDDDEEGAEQINHCHAQNTAAGILPEVRNRQFV